jgi:multiple sugar transport system ATP-binding protein
MQRWSSHSPIWTGTPGRRLRDVTAGGEIGSLHDRLGVTTIYVTNDQIEAMTMADRIVIMRDGVIQQVAEPDDMYAQPANVFVAGFIGSPAMNFFQARLEPHRDGLSVRSARPRCRCRSLRRSGAATRTLR